MTPPVQFWYSTFTPASRHCGANDAAGAVLVQHLHTGQPALRRDAAEQVEAVADALVGIAGEHGERLAVGSNVVADASLVYVSTVNGPGVDQRRRAATRIPEPIPAGGGQVDLGGTAAVPGQARGDQTRTGHLDHVRVPHAAAGRQQIGHGRGQESMKRTTGGRAGSGGDTRHVAAVPVAVGGRGHALGGEVVPEDDLAGEVGVRGVDARIEDGDHDVWVPLQAIAVDVIPDQGSDPDPPCRIIQLTPAGVVAIYDTELAAQVVC
jgi:hypothetical protein